MNILEINKDHYIRLGRLIESAPDMSTVEAVQSHAVLQWLGRASALVQVAGVGGDPVLFSSVAGRLNSAAWKEAKTEIFAMLYRALARFELDAPAAVSGAFIPVGNSFDAYAAVSKILKTAKNDIFIVDPYLDETVLIDFGSTVPEGVHLRLMADAKNHKTSLVAAGQRWVAQHGMARPLEIRLAQSRLLHDRLIFVDGASSWALTQSIKDFAKRSPAEIIRADEAATLKISAYEETWEKSEPVV